MDDAASPQMCLGLQRVLSDECLIPRKAISLSALQNIKNIESFREQAEALNISVRITRPDGKVGKWRNKSDILAEYVKMFEQVCVPSEGPSGSPISEPAPIRLPVSVAAPCHIYSTIS